MFQTLEQVPRMQGNAAELSFRQEIASLEMIPSGGGVYEISVDGKNIYSKKATGEFPDEDAVVVEIRSMLKSTGIFLSNLTLTPQVA